MAIFAEITENRTSALMTGTCAITSKYSSLLSNDWSSQRTATYISPKLAHPAARSLCDSWATCYNYRSIYRNTKDN